MHLYLTNVGALSPFQVDLYNKSNVDLIFSYVGVLVHLQQFQFAN